MTNPLDDSGLSGDELARLRLVASRSLLSERRRGARRGFLVDSIVAVLARHGGRGEAYLKDTVRNLWGTTTITDTVFDQAITEAEAAGLISRQLTVDDREKWVASAQSVEDVTVDRDWVDRQFEQFVDEIRVRVIGFTDEEYLQRKAADIGDRVTEAIAHGCSVGYETTDARKANFVRPTEIDPTAVRRFTKRLSDNKMRDPVQALTEAALDEFDDFGLS